MAHSGSISTTACSHPPTQVVYNHTIGEEKCLECGKNPALACIHPKNRIIYDHTNGDEVCTMCALVVSERIADGDELGFEDDAYFDSVNCLSKRQRLDTLVDTRLREEDLPPSVEGPQMMPTKSASAPRAKANRQQLFQQKVRREIREVCSRLFMDTDSLISSAHAIYFSQPPVGRYKYIVDRKNLAYSVYVACIKQHTPRSPKLIAEYCRVKPKSILMMQKSRDECEDTLNASDYVDRIGHFMEVPFYIRRLTEVLLKKKQEELEGRRPESVAAAALFSVFKKLRAKYQPGLPTANLQRWSQQLNIPTRTLRTVIEKIPKFTIKACGGLENCFYTLYTRDT